MGRKQKEKTYIKSIRVNTDIKEFLDIFVCAFGSLGIPPQRKASLNVVEPLGGTTFKKPLILFKKVITL
jgi:hypothetical protein